MNPGSSAFHDFFSETPLCIGIGGVSRSGKTFLAAMISEILPNSELFCQDEYVHASDLLPVINNHIDWEIPGSIDWDRLFSDASKALENGKHVIVEGLMAFADERLNRLFNRHIFLTLGKEEFEQRKKTDLRWGKEPEWYIAHIWDSFLKYGKLPANIPDALILDAEQDFDLNKVVKYLRKL
jgi:uridine kinase